MALPMGLQPEGIPDAVHGRARQLALLGYRTDGPMGSIFRLGMKCLADEGRYCLVRNRSGTSRAQFVMETGDALLKVALTPFADGLHTETDLFGDGVVGNALSSHHNDTGPRYNAMGKGTGVGYRFQLFALLLHEDKRSSRSSSSHGLSPSEKGQVQDSTRPIVIQAIYETLH